MNSDHQSKEGGGRESNGFPDPDNSGAARNAGIPVEWNRTAVPYPSDKRLHELVEAQAERTPDAIAVEFEGLSLTYRELDRRANALAGLLQRKGVGRNDLAPLLLERSPEMIVAMLGVLKAGAAYVPMDPDAPEDRLRYQMQDTGARVALTQCRFADRAARVAGQTVEAIALDGEEIRARLADAPAEINPEGSPTDAVYVLYTSGTTGRPKGVILEHRAVCNRLVWMQNAYSLSAEDRILQKTPYTFDVSGWEFFWPLIAGARLVFARPSGHKDPSYLREIIRGSRITVLHFVPSMLRTFLLTDDGEDCPSLRRVVCSGEELPVPLKDRFLERFPGVELDNLYGPTEAAIDVTAYRCRREDRLVPIGKPIANTQIHIVDAAMQPVPVGETGDLCIAGDCLARGYLNQPELTAAKFVDHPLEPGKRVYRTGDLARWLPDGNIEYLGRADHQIKIRGNRVELGEIESVILECPETSACAVVASGGEHEHLRLAAYVVPDPRRAPGVSRQLRLGREGRLAGVSLQPLANGVEVAQLNPSETAFLDREIFEQRAYRRHGIRIEDGDCILDVGANIGLFSLALFLEHEGLQVHAFEPIPETYRALAANAELFGNGWVAHPFGLGEKPGRRRVHLLSSSDDGVRGGGGSGRRDGGGAFGDAARPGRGGPRARGPGGRRAHPQPPDRENGGLPVAHGLGRAPGAGTRGRSPPQDRRGEDGGEGAPRHRGKRLDKDTATRHRGP